MATIADLRKRYPDLRDDELVHTWAEATGQAPDQTAYNLGLDPTAFQQDDAGFTSAAQNSLYGMAGSVGQIGQDLTGGAVGKSLEEFGDRGQYRNPVTLMEGDSDSAFQNVLTNFADAPVGSTAQALGVAAGFMGPQVGLKVANTGYRALRGIQAVTAPSRAASAAGAVGNAAYYGLPSYGSIRDVQEMSGHNDAVDLLAAGTGAMTVGALEGRFGPEAWISRGVNAGIGGAGKNFARTGLKTGLIEGAEEMAQTPVERAASYEDVFSMDTLDQMAAGGVVGFAAGAPMGMAAHPFMKKPMSTTEPRDLIAPPAGSDPQQQDIFGQYGAPRDFSEPLPEEPMGPSPVAADPYARDLSGQMSFLDQVMQQGDSPTNFDNTVAADPYYGLDAEAQAFQDRQGGVSGYRSALEGAPGTFENVTPRRDFAIPGVREYGAVEQTPEQFMQEQGLPASDPVSAGARIAELGAVLATPNLPPKAVAAIKAEIDSLQSKQKQMPNQGTSMPNAGMQQAAPAAPKSPIVTVRETARANGVSPKAWTNFVSKYGITNASPEQIAEALRDRAVNGRGGMSEAWEAAHTALTGESITDYMNRQEQPAPGPTTGTSPAATSPQGVFTQPQGNAAALPEMGEQADKFDNEPAFVDWALGKLKATPAIAEAYKRYFQVGEFATTGKVSFDTLTPLLGNNPATGKPYVHATVGDRVKRLKKQIDELAPQHLNLPAAEEEATVAPGPTLTDAEARALEGGVANTAITAEEAGTDEEVFNDFNIGDRNASSGKERTASAGAVWDKLAAGRENGVKFADIPDEVATQFSDFVSQVYTERETATKDEKGDKRSTLKQKTKKARVEEAFKNSHDAVDSMAEAVAEQKARNAAKGRTVGKLAERDTTGEDVAKLDRLTEDMVGGNVESAPDALALLAGPNSARLMQHLKSRFGMPSTVLTPKEALEYLLGRVAAIQEESVKALHENTARMGRVWDALPGAVAWENLPDVQKERFVGAALHLVDEGGSNIVLEYIKKDIENELDGQTAGTGVAARGAEGSVQGGRPAADENRGAAGEGGQAGSQPASVRVKKRRTIVRDDAEGVTPADSDRMLSEGRRRRGQDAGAMRDALRKMFFGAALFDKRVVVVQSADELPPGQEIEEEYKNNVQGFYDTGSGKVYLIADNIAPGRALGVFFHEVGGHMGMADLLGRHKFDSLYRQIRAWASGTDGKMLSTGNIAVENLIAANAMGRVNDAIEGASGAMTADILKEELIAYFIEEAVKAGFNPTALETVPSSLRQWFNTLWTAVRNAVQKLGVRPDSLTAQDVVDLAYGAARLQLSGAESDLKAAHVTTGRPPYQSTRMEDAGTRNSVTGMQEFKDAKNDAFLNATSYKQALDALHKQAFQGYEAGQMTFEQADQIYENLIAKNKSRLDALHKESFKNGYMYSIAPADALDTVYQFGDRVDFGNRWNAVTPKLMTLHQLKDWFGDKLVHLKDYVQNFDKMSMAQQRIMQDGHKVTQEWVKLHKATQKVLHKVMLDATMDGMHPDLDITHEDNKHIGADKRAEFAALKARYEAMPEDAKAVYQAAKKQLADNWQKRREIFASVVTATYDARIKARDPKTDADEIARLEKERDRTIREHSEKIKEIKGPYFPLMRFGDYIVVSQSAEMQDLGKRLEEAKGDERKALEKKYAKMRTEGKHYMVEAFQSNAVAERRAQQMRGRGYAAVDSFKADQFNRQFQPFAASGLEHINHMVDAAFGSNSQDRAAAAKMKDLMTEVYISAMPEHAALTRQLKREGIEGASDEMLRAFGEVVEKDAFFLSRMQYSKDLADNLFHLKREARSAGVKYQHVYDNLQQRVALDFAYNRTPVQDMISKASGIFHLGIAPAFLLTNMTQPWMITVPQLAGKHGAVKVFGAMRNAWVDSGRLIKQGKGGVFNLKDLDFAALPEGAERDMLKHVADLGQLDITQTADMGLLAEGTPPALYKGMKVFNWATHHIELHNRVTTALAAFRLETAKGATYEEARDAAYDAVVRTQLDYSGTNAAYFMKQGVGPLGGMNKLVFQFRKYQQGMLYLLIRDARLAFGGDTQAMKSFAYLMGMQIAMAGAAGVPLFAPMLLLLSLGFDDDDERGDPVTWLRNLAADAMGEDAARTFFRGLPTMLGVDVSNNLGMGSLLSPMPMLRTQSVTDPKTGKEAVQELLYNVPGAWLGMGTGVVDAFVSGDASKAAPRFIRNPMKAAKYASEGMTTRTGEAIFSPDQFDGWDLAYRALGFSTVKESEHYAAKQAKENTSRSIKERRDSLLREYAQARLRGDSTEDVEREVSMFNADHPHRDFRIDRSSLLRALKARKDRGKDTDEETGVTFRRNEDALRDVTRFAK